VSGASLITAALTTLLVNARHLFYGISMVDKYKNVKYKNVLAFLLTDETYSLVCTDEEKSHTYYMLVSLLDYSYWVSGSILGSVLGNIIPFSTEGIDFALTALFITVFVDQWLNHKDHIPAIVGVMASILCLLLFGADSFLIPTMIMITILLLVYKKWGNAHE
jgi:4-azaleucine resistance transporter AzlC